MACLSAVVLVAVACLAKASLSDGDDAYCWSSVEQNLNMHKLKGDWWEAESFNTDSFVEVDDKCHVSRFYPDADGKKILVSSDYVNTDKEHKKYSFTILDKDPKNDGHLVAQMKILKPAVGKAEIKYNIMATDYDNYMLVTLCYDAFHSDQDFKAGLLLVRQGVDLDSTEIGTKIKAALSENNLDRSYFQANRLKSCAAVAFAETFTASK